MKYFNIYCGNGHLSMMSSFSFSRLSLALTRASHLPDSEWAGVEYKDGYWLINCNKNTTWQNCLTSAVRYFLSLLLFATHTKKSLNEEGLNVLPTWLRNNYYNIITPIGQQIKSCVKMKWFWCRIWCQTWSILLQLENRTGCLWLQAI